MPDYVVSVKEKFDSQPGTAWRSDGHREYNRYFIVKTSGPNIGAETVCRAAGLPLPYAPYITDTGSDSDLLALMVDIKADLLDKESRKVWLVTCLYSTRIPDEGFSMSRTGSVASGAQNNPEEEPPEIEWDFEVVQKAREKDLLGNPFVNSAGQPYTPTPTFETARAIFVLTRNERSFSRVKATDYAFAINSDVFLGAAPGTAQCLPPRAKMKSRGSLTYYRVTYRIRFNHPKPVDITNPAVPAAGGGPGAVGGALGPASSGELETWQPRILDAGLCERQKFAGIPWKNQPVPIVRNGHPVSSPVCLDGLGGAISISEAGKFIPVYNQYTVYQMRPFAKILTSGLGG